MILLAVSGGIDSMYLANRAPELIPGASFAVAHCNFSLRGAESDGDEAFVRDWCSRNGVSCHFVRFDTEAHAREHGVSIEMAARDLRYGWFASLCREHGYEAVATAHNANDNAETLCLNLLRGTGTRGIRGMAAEGQVPGAPDIPLLRPLLSTSRAEIRAWMEANGQGWREDSTNAGTDYKRNRLRNNVFPEFEKINPSFVRTLGEDMQRFGQVDDIAEDYFLSCGIEPGCRDIPVDALLALRHWEYVLWRLLEPYGFSQETFGKLTALLRRYREEPRGTVTLSGKSFEAPAYMLKASRKTLSVVGRLQSGSEEGR